MWWCVNLGKVEDGEIAEEGGEKEARVEVVTVAGPATGIETERKPVNSFFGEPRHESNQRGRRAMVRNFVCPREMGVLFFYAL